MADDPPPIFSVVITTRNRVDDLLVAIESALAQAGTSVEVLVYDDASEDDTADRVSRAFPDVRLFPKQTRQGYIVHRNAGYREARGEFVVSIDDDAYFSDPGTLARAAELFAEYPDAGGLALPFIEPFKERGSGKMFPVPVGTPLRGYVGCAHVVRRDLFLQLGGYRECLIHQGEERDFCIRLLDAGHQVFYADTPVIVHSVNPSRSRRRMTYFGYRNTILFAALNFPQPYVVPRMLLSCGQLLLYRFRLPEFPYRLWALLAGFGVSLRHYGDRRPIRRETYQRFRQLAGHGPLDWNEDVPRPVTLADVVEPNDALEREQAG